MTQAALKLAGCLAILTVVITLPPLFSSWKPAYTVQAVSKQCKHNEHLRCRKQTGKVLRHTRHKTEES